MIPETEIIETKNNILLDSSDISTSSENLKINEQNDVNNNDQVIVEETANEIFSLDEQGEKYV